MLSFFLVQNVYCRVHSGGVRRGGYVAVAHSGLWANLDQFISKHKITFFNRIFVNGPYKDYRG